MKLESGSICQGFSSVKDDYMDTIEGTEYSQLLADAESGEISWSTHYSELEHAISLYWDPNLPRTFFQGPIDPPWSFGITAPFRKSIKNIDRKLQGRVLEAVLKICDSPLTPYGDTIKPLQGSLGGLWRVRIGDHRLIYQPSEEDRKVLLLEFGPRGGIYD